MCPRGPPCVAFAAVGSFEVGNKPPLPPPPPLGLPPSLASAGNRQVRVRNWISQGHAGHVLNRFLVIDWLHSGYGRHPTQRKEAPATKDKRKWIWKEIGLTVRHTVAVLIIRGFITPLFFLYFLIMTTASLLFRSFLLRRLSFKLLFNFLFFLQEKTSSSSLSSEMDGKMCAGAACVVQVLLVFCVCVSVCTEACGKREKWGPLPFCPFSVFLWIQAHRIISTYLPVDWDSAPVSNWLL